MVRAKGSDWPDSAKCGLTVRLDFSIRARRLAYKNIWLRVENAGWDQIKISFGDKREKWDREVTLMNEPDVLEKLKAATVK